MTTTYDPFHPKYFDETDLRDELTRVFDLCHGCRLCFKFCTAFPTLFRFVDEADLDASRLTPAQQDQVVDECFNCKLCYINCPYVPGKHEWALDFPRLMLRAKQVRQRNGARSWRERLSDEALSRTDLAGRVGSAAAPVVNRMIGTPGSLPRRVMEKTVGIAAQRVLPPYARQRFTTWFRSRSKRPRSESPAVGGREVAVFASCLVEYQDPDIGKDLVRVYEHNGINCSVPDGQRCCGAPWLHSGDVDRFIEQAEHNVSVLAEVIRDGRDVVVPQPTCSFVLKHDYLDYLNSPGAKLVAEHTYDASEYLWKLHQSARTSSRDDNATGGDEGGQSPTGLTTEFTGAVPASITYHAPCHLRAQSIGLPSRNLLALTGAEVRVVAECSAIDGTWGYRAENYERSRQVAAKMADAVRRAGTDVVVGDCHLANGAIAEETGVTARHPLQVLARAYGIPEED
ncbi:MAG: heterodisulfide reductase-related iron-sulfur binding cluster [Acidimicrobiales bacterium]|nr:heterodisulfide reductase-related iron-sulfur binding cluster [Acidimicrobiales bacterium]